MKEKIRAYIQTIKKYSFKVFKTISIIVFLLSLIFIFIYNPEFRTLGYKIRSYTFRLQGYLIPFWMLYLVYKTLTTEENSAMSTFAGIVAIGPLTFLMFVTFFFGFFGSYGSGAYDECMEMCVTEDLSNYKACEFGTCDFPI
jgi:quinol-cytochrome oxidoreductase complex cytochrome b subunit